MYKNLILIILCFSLLIAGCSSATSKPKEIRKEIWDNANMVYDALVVSMENRELLGEYEFDLFKAMYKKYVEDMSTDLTKEEYELLNNLNEMFNGNYGYMFYEYKNNEETNQHWLNRFEEGRVKTAIILNK